MKCVYTSLVCKHIFVVVHDKFTLSLNLNVCVCAFLPVDCNKQKRKWHGDEVLIKICQPLGFHSSCDGGQAFS